MRRFFLLMAAALAALAAPAGAAPIPFKHESASVAGSVGAGGFGVLLISLVAIAAVLYLRKRFNLKGPLARGPRLLNVLETARLGPRSLLTVVEFRGQQYLLAQGEHGITCVATVPAEGAPAPAPEKEPA